MQRKHTGRGIIPESGGLLHRGSRNLLLQKPALPKRIIQDGMDRSGLLESTGLLTICAWCKKIRDEEGRWQQLEGYISLHSDSKFTHGLCEECAAHITADIRLTTREHHAKDERERHRNFNYERDIGAERSGGA